MHVQTIFRTARPGLLTLCVGALYACGGGSGGNADTSALGGGAGATTPAVSTPGTATPAIPNTPVTETPTPAVPTLAALQTLDDGTRVGAATFAAGPTATGGLGQAVQGLACAKPVQSGPAYTYTHLNLLVDGQAVALPEGIGAVAPGSAGIADAPTREVGCFYPLQTTDSSGKVRHPPAGAAPYTLGQFFALWGQPLGTANVAGYSGKAVKAFVRDGTSLTEYTGALEALELAPGREITLQVGTAPAAIPYYEWTNPAPLSATPLLLRRGSYDPASSGQFGLEDNRTNGKGGQGQPVAGLACYGPRNQTTFDYTYHVHAHLAIFKDGVRMAIPPLIGVVGDDNVPSSVCDYPLHTHDTTGTLHVEAFSATLTLGQFFEIWGQPLTRANVGGLPSSTPAVVYVQDGGNLRKYQGDPAGIELKSYRSIVIELGTPLAEIPAYALDETQ